MGSRHAPCCFYVALGHCAECFWKSAVLVHASALIAHPCNPTGLMNISNVFVIILALDGPPRVDTVHHTYCQKYCAEATCTIHTVKSHTAYRWWTLLTVTYSTHYKFCQADTSSLVTSD